MSSIASVKRMSMVDRIISKLSHLKSESFSKVAFDIDIDEYFEICKKSLSTPPSKKTNQDIFLICGFFLYLKGFLSMLSQNNSNNTYEVMRIIAGSLEYEKWQSNRMIMRNGEKGNKFYIILQGNVDILIPKKIQVEMTKEEYLTYLALLIVYREFELLERVVIENFAIYPVEITDIDKIMEKGASRKMSFRRTSSLKTIRKTSSDEGKKEEEEEVENTNFTVKELMKHLNEAQKRDYDLYHSNGSMRCEVDNGIYITSSMYINRLKEYQKVKTEKKQDYKEDDKNKTIVFTIYEYCIICQLKTGSKFGDIALTNQNAKRTATILTSSECHFGVLNKKTFNDSLSEASMRYRKSIMLFITSTYIFTNFPMKALQNNYFNCFVIINTIRDSKIISKGSTNNKLILLRRGEYELTYCGSLFDMTTLIINLFKTKMKKVISKDALKLSINDEEQDIVSAIRLLKGENAKILSLCKSNGKLREEYSKISKIKVCLLTSPDIIGISSYEDGEGKSIFDVKCNSADGEYLLLDKMQDYQSMTYTDQTLRPLERKISYMKTTKLIKRLINIRKSRLMMYFKCSENEIKKKLSELEDNDIEIKSSNRKSKRCISEIRSSFDKDKVKKIFVAQKMNKDKLYKISIKSLSQLKLPVVQRLKMISYPKPNKKSRDSHVLDSASFMRTTSFSSIEVKALRSVVKTLNTSQKKINIKNLHYRDLSDLCRHLNHNDDNKENFNNEELSVAPYHKLKKSKSTFTLLDLSSRKRGNLTMRDNSKREEEFIKKRNNSIIQKARDIFTRFGKKINFTKIHHKE